MNKFANWKKNTLKNNIFISKLSTRLDVQKMLPAVWLFALAVLIETGFNSMEKLPFVKSHRKSAEKKNPNNQADINMNGVMVTINGYTSKTERVFVLTKIIRGYQIDYSNRYVLYLIHEMKLPWTLEWINIVVDGKKEECIQ